MSLSKEQLKYDRINLGRLVKRLEHVISDDCWVEKDQQNREDVWVKAQGMAQKIRYAKQLLVNVDYYEASEPGSSGKALQQNHLSETLDKLEKIVDKVKQRLESESQPIVLTSYLSLVPLPKEDDTARFTHDVVEPNPEAELIPSNSVSEHLSLVEDPTLDLLPSSSTPRMSESARAPSPAKMPPTSSLLSASLQTHEELSNELSRMATQLKRNAQHFSDSLDKDKSLIQSAADVLEKNYDTMTKERVRLKDHRSKSFGTTWMVFGSLLVVSITWVFMFFIIRLT